MLLPLQTLTLRTIFFCMYVYIYIHTNSQVYMYHTIDSILLYRNPSCANSHMLMPCRTLTLWTSLYTWKCIHENIHLLYDRYFCIWTQIVRIYICICRCQSTLWSSLYTSTYLQIYICHSIDTRVRIWAHAVQTHICFCPCERSHLEPLCIHQFFLEVYIFSIIDTFLYERMLCKLTYVCGRASPDT